jgi:membrane protein DedA with SNARE-associated domain/membrane-associated phospholipid phosphatase
VIEHLIRDLANSLGHWAYLLVAVMATSETAAFVGFIAPGEFTIILGGVLAGEGTLSIHLLIGIVWASIVTGDSIGFLIGRRYGRNFLIKHGPRVRLTEERMLGVEAYFKRHGGKTIFFGRWVGFVRPLMPFTAGTSGMPYRRFLPYDVLSAGLFGSFFTLLGYIFWRNFNTVAKVVGRGALGLGVLVAIVVGGIFAFKRLRHREQRERLAARMQQLGRSPALRPLAFVLAPAWSYVVRPLWRWAIRPVWRHLLRPAGRALAPPLRFLAHRLTPGQLGIELTTLIAIAAVFGFIFGAYTDVLGSGPAVITPGDGFARDIAVDIESGTLTAFAKVVTVAGQWPVAAGVGALTLPLLVARRRILDAAVLVAGFGLTQAGIYVTKAAVDRPRPSDALVDVGGSGFPSGHAATAVTYMALAVVAARMLRGYSARVAVVVSAAVLVAAIGLTRVYLRVHYLSDVVAGWSLGLATFSLCGCVALVISYLRNNEPTREPQAVPAPAGTTSDG